MKKELQIKCPVDDHACGRKGCILSPTLPECDQHVNNLAVAYGIFREGIALFWYSEEGFQKRWSELLNFTAKRYNIDPDLFRERVKDEIYRRSV